MSDGGRALAAFQNMTISFIVGLVVPVFEILAEGAELFAPSFAVFSTAFLFLVFIPYETGFIPGVFTPFHRDD